MELNKTQLKDIIYLLDYAVSVTERQHEPVWHSRALMYRLMFENELLGAVEPEVLPEGVGRSVTL